MRGRKGIGFFGLVAAIALGVALPGRAVSAASLGAPSGVSTSSAAARTSAIAGTVSPNLSNYVPISPFRILDTRSGSCVQCSGLALGPGAKRTLQLTGVTGLSIGADPIPADASAVVLNVTVVGATATSVLTLYPYGWTLPQASNL